MENMLISKRSGIFRCPEYLIDNIIHNIIDNKPPDIAQISSGVTKPPTKPGKY